MSAAAQGDVLIASGSLKAAISAYTTAIEASPGSPEYYIKRAIAHHRALDYISALRDCETAVTLAYKRGNRTVRGLAQFRRSIALCCLSRPQDANYCLEKAIADGCREKSIPVWQDKINAAMEAHPEIKLSIKEIPESDLSQDEAEEGVPSAESSSIATSPANLVDKTDRAASATTEKYEWYQNAQEVIISFYFKKVKQDQCRVDIGPSSLSVEFSLPESNSEYIHDFEHLFGVVDPAKSSYRILSTKVEVSLHKAEKVKWSTLEATAAATAPTASRAPLYPTSSRTGAKNWESIGNSAEEDKKDGEAALTDLFQTLYKDADEDTKKAMIKSYTESGGTSLSTDWKSVGKAKVEVSPPDGMVARKYES